MRDRESSGKHPPTRKIMKSVDVIKIVSKGGDAVQLDEVLSKPKLHELGKVLGSNHKGGFAGKVLAPSKQEGF